MLISRVTTVPTERFGLLPLFSSKAPVSKKLFMCSDYSRNSDSAQQIFIENLVSFRYFLVPGSIQIE